MFKLYQSNDFLILENVFLYILKNENKNNNLKLNVLIPNNNLAFKLKMLIAKNFGICCNIKFILPINFIWNIYKNYFNENISKNFLSKENLILIIIKILPKLLNKKEFFVFKKYLYNDENSFKLFSLSNKIAELYDKYLVYRLDWLKEWEKGKLIKNINNVNQIWQAILWKKIINFVNLNFEYKLNRSNIHFEILNLLKYKNIFKNIINSIFIFNVLFLPPLYLNIFNSISNYIDIHYFLINPCKEYWYDIFFLKKNIKNLLYFNDLEFRNININLLYYGKSLAEYLYLLISYNIYFLDFFYKRSNNNIINIIKNNILFFDDLYKTNKHIKKLDNSITIKCSYGYINEIIELKNYLLYLIKELNYKVCDIIVVVSDIKIYYPYIESIFLDIKYKKILPIFIMDENLLYDNMIFNLFIKILNLNNITCNLSEILSLLNNEVILEHFNISNDEFKIILNITNSFDNILDISNIFIKNKNYNKIYNDSVINKIKNILLGYAINKTFCVWNKIYPYITIDNSFFHELISKLSDFIFKFFYWKNIFSFKYTIISWIDICELVMFDFFSENIRLNSKFLNIKNWKKLLHSIKVSKFKNKISIELFIKIINVYLKRKRCIKQYSINHINFCSTLPLRSIPFKVICLIGMNSNVYPKNFQICNFDLMNLYPRLGDINKIDKEKYLFLEYCLSVKHKLYISYINFSFINFSICYPSILIDNFIYYINNILNINLYINNVYIIKNSNFIVYKKNKYKNIIYVNKKINEINNINLIYLLDVYKFWFNPLIFFVKYCLNVKCLDLFFKINNKNFFSKINVNKFYIFKIKILKNLIKGKKFNNNFIIYIQILGLIPYGTLGKILWKIEKNKILNLFRKIKNLYWENKIIRLLINIKNIRILSLLNINIYNDHIKWMPKNINFIDILLFWIDHIIYCYKYKYNVSKLFGYNGCFILLPLNKKICKIMLYFYINGFLSGLKKPLWFLPKSSNNWLFQIYDFKNKKIILNNIKSKLAFLTLKKTMYGNDFLNGELNNKYIYYLIKSMKFKINYNIIINNAKKWLFPILDYLIWKK